MPSDPPRPCQALCSPPPSLRPSSLPGAPGAPQGLPPKTSRSRETGSGDGALRRGPAWPRAGGAQGPGGPERSAGRPPAALLPASARGAHCPREGGRQAWATLPGPCPSTRSGPLRPVPFPPGRGGRAGGHGAGRGPGRAQGQGLRRVCAPALGPRRARPGSRRGSGPLAACQRVSQPPAGPGRAACEDSCLFFLPWRGRGRARAEGADHWFSH